MKIRIGYKQIVGYVFLALAVFLIIYGLFYALGLIPHPNYYYIERPVTYEGNTCYVFLTFSSPDGFFAQSPIHVTYNLNGVYYSDGYYPCVFFKDSCKASILSNDSVDIFGNMSGISIPLKSTSDFKEINFPIEGDYEAFIVFQPKESIKREPISIGKVIHVSSPESATLFELNNTMTGFSLIVTGMTIIQILISLRQHTK